MIKNKTVLLVVLDGYGIAKSSKGNAISQANKPNMDFLSKHAQHIPLHASGLDVGLPENQMGNSETGHINLGAGRIVFQPLPLINNAIADGSFYDNEVLQDAFKKAQDNKTNLHLIGLVSDGGVHSHSDHFFALMKMSQNYNIKNIFIHAFLDGRDTSYKSGYSCIENLIEEIDKYKNIHLFSLAGRYYAMDRDKRFERTTLSYKTLIGESEISFKNPLEYIKTSYENEVYDEFVLPASNENCAGQIKENDSVIGVNFRPDRMVQISSFLTNKKYLPDNLKHIDNLTFVQMARYADSVHGEIAFKKEAIKNTLAEVISQQNLPQYHIAETEKYAHVTYFFAGGSHDPFPLEDRELIPSPKVATYDKKPSMSACEITSKLVEQINSQKYEFLLVNYANADMVGHTGDLKATIKAVETIDDCIGKLIKVIKETDGILLITADHGNAEYMLKGDQPVTAHTNNKVPLFIYNNVDYKINHDIESPRLSDVAPTILKLMGISIPSEMKGRILINEKN